MTHFCYCFWLVRSAFVVISRAASWPICYCFWLSTQRACAAIVVISRAASWPTFLKIVNKNLFLSQQRLPLLQSGHQNGGQLQPGSSIDQVLSHEVKELGTHILVCEVSYCAPNKPKLNFRKFFKFNVMKPLDVKTKFYNAESEDVFLEAQVQNITVGPLCLEKVGLDPSPMFKVWFFRQIEWFFSMFFESFRNSNFFSIFRQIEGFIQYFEDFCQFDVSAQKLIFQKKLLWTLLIHCA